MSVAYDNAAIDSGYNVTELETAIEIGSGTNRAALVCLHTYANDPTGDEMSGSCGGVSLSAVSLYYGNLNGVLVFGCVNPASGNQTASLSWTTTHASWKYLGVLTLAGAAQTSTFDGVVTATIAYNSTPVSVEITSDSGDLTVSFAGTSGTANTTNQTERYGAGTARGCDTGPGTGTATHTWSASGSARKACVGVNVNQAAAGGLSIPVAMHHYQHNLGR